MNIFDVCFPVVCKPRLMSLETWMQCYVPLVWNQRGERMLSNILDFLNWKVREMGEHFAIPLLIQPQLEVNDSLRKEF